MCDFLRQYYRGVYSFYDMAKKFIKFCTVTSNFLWNLNFVKELVYMGWGKRYCSGPYSKNYNRRVLNSVPSDTLNSLPLDTFQFISMCSVYPCKSEGFYKLFEYPIIFHLDARSCSGILLLLFPFMSEGFCFLAKWGVWIRGWFFLYILF